jgi:hypothetical protein
MLGIYARLRQLDLDRCPYPFSRTEGDAAPHPLGELLTDGQPQTEPLGAAPSLVKTLEDMREIGGAYPGSLVFHGNDAGPQTNPDGGSGSTFRELFSREFTHP